MAKNLKANLRNTITDFATFGVFDAGADGDFCSVIAASGCCRWRGFEGSHCAAGAGVHGARLERRQREIVVISRASGAVGFVGDRVPGVPSGDANFDDLHRRFNARGLVMLAVSDENAGTLAQFAREQVTNDNHRLALLGFFGFGIDFQR